MSFNQGDDCNHLIYSAPTCGSVLKISTCYRSPQELVKWLSLEEKAIIIELLARSERANKVRKYTSIYV